MAFDYGKGHLQVAKPGDLVEGNVKCAIAPMQVATPKDPASARLGESLYNFLPRSVVGNLRDGIVMELDRLRARQMPFFCLQNR